MEEISAVQKKHWVCDTHSSTLTSNYEKSWGSDAARESYVSCCGGLYQWIHQASTVAVCKERLCYSQTYLVGSHLKDFLLSVISYLVQFLT